MNKKLSPIFFLFVPAFFLIGAFAYQFMYPLKTFIRLRELHNITYIEALVKFVSRLSSFSNSCAAYEKSKDILDLSYRYSREHAELLYFFNTITPGFLYDKSFQPMNTLLLKAYISMNAGFSNFDLGPTYYYLLYKLSLIDYVFYFVILLLNAFLHFFFLIFLAPLRKSNYVTFIYSTNFFSLLLAGSGLNMQSTWITLIFTVVILWIFGVVKIYKKKSGCIRCYLV